ncbi:HET-domain-containing protein, partial [Lophium mytilinum]
ICRNLSVRCRWIDSLCIIQHDALDWEQESSRMGDIYARSFLTIAATKPRSRKIGTFGYRWDPLEHEPLNKWGWTLQERLLSTRIPHCGSNHMYWEC